jgi:hypothetical protein
LPGHYLKQCSKCLNCRQDGHASDNCPFPPRTRPGNRMAPSA